MNKMEKQWTEKAKKALLGKKIINVRYMSKEESAGIGWHRRSIVIELDDNTLIFPSMDDEGNDAGALFTDYKDLPVIPVF